MMMNDKGQVTIFVIVAMVIVFAIFFLFLINKKDVSLREYSTFHVGGNAKEFCPILLFTPTETAV